MATSDTNISNFIINQIPKSTLNDLVENNNVPANQIFVTPEDGFNIAITTTPGSESISDGTNTLSFGANAFTSTTIPSTTNSVTQGSSSALTSGGAYTALSGKEAISNKVTSISSQSTDSQYPSAKCVYDIVGNIETLLGGI